MDNNLYRQNIYNLLISTDERQRVLDVQHAHLETALTGRVRYQNSVARAKAAAVAAGAVEMRPMENPPSIGHYSWDYAQNVSLPSASDQVGPTYFASLRKCHIFGICCEAFPKQVGFLLNFYNVG